MKSANRGILLGFAGLVGLATGCDERQDGRGAGGGIDTLPDEQDDDGAADGAADDDDDEDDEDVDTGEPAEDDDGLGDCAEIEVEIDTISPTIMVLVDRSWSMTKDFNGVARWDAVFRTLLHTQDGIITRLEDQVRFGLTLFTSKNGNNSTHECPILTEVEPALGNALQIEDVMGNKKPVDETPTGESLMLVAEALADVEAEGPKAIVLATDGEPDTCDQPNPDKGDAVALQAAAAAHDLGIEVFVISVGDEVSAEHLQQMANVGVGRPPDAPDPAPYFQALDAEELVDAFGSIVEDLVTCESKIHGMVDLDQVCEGTVLLDGEELECGVDFELADEQTLVLVGAACDTLKSGGKHSLAASWPCDAINIP